MENIDVMNSAFDLCAEEPTSFRYQALSKRIDNAIEILDEALTEEQRKVLAYISDLFEEKEDMAVKRGIIYGMQYMQNINEITRAPEQSINGFNATLDCIADIYPTPSMIQAKNKKKYVLD